VIVNTLASRDTQHQEGQVGKEKKHLRIYLRNNLTGVGLANVVAQKWRDYRPRVSLRPGPGDVDASEGLVRKVGERRRREVKIGNGAAPAPVSDSDSSALALV